MATLTAYSLNAEALKRFRDAGARDYMPKVRAGDLIPFGEEVLY